MKKVLCFAIISLLCVPPLFAAMNPFDQFTKSLSGVTTEVAQKKLDSFAKDLGSLMDSGAFHSGATLGIPGFDVSLRASSKKISDDNDIVKSAGIDTAYFPVLQAEIGLPAHFDLLGRFSSYENSSMAGGGLRYGILNYDFPGMPSLSLQALYNALNVDSGVNKLKASTLSAMAMLSFNLPVVDPYVGIGMDQTTVEPDTTLSLPQKGMKGDASGVRIEAGVNIGLFPFTYLQVGGTLTDGAVGYTAGLGAKF